jgi:hypothetical protein
MDAFLQQHDFLFDFFELRIDLFFPFLFVAGEEG